MSNFLTRALTGSVFLVVMIGGIYWNYSSLSILFFIIAMLGLNEFYGLLIKSGNAPQHISGLLLGGVLFGMIAFIIPIGFQLVFYIFFILLALIFFIELYRRKEKPFQNIAYTIVGIIYTVMPFALWVSFMQPGGIAYGGCMNGYNPHLLLGYFFLMWTNDTGAYLVGRAIGKHKLWERISPKKTWEGFFGGMILSMAIGYVSSLFYPELHYIIWIIMAVIVTVTGTMGDLVESAFKRSIDVKDSGNILPGHGGILDRFDGVFLSTPFVLALLETVRMVYGMVE